MMTDTQNNAIKKEGTRYVANYYKSLVEDVMKEAFFRRLTEQNLKDLKR